MTEIDVICDALFRKANINFQVVIDEGMTCGVQYEDQDDITVARRLLLAACAAGFFWLFAVHVLTGLLDFMTKGGVGSRSGMVANIDDIIDSLLVVHLGGPLTAGVLLVAGIGAAWLIYRSPR